MNHLSTDIYRRIVLAKIFIDENYQAPINLSDVSKKAFLSKFHFHRLFTQIYKRTPHRYITECRLSRARDLLTENRPVQEVCNEVGFESLGSFSVLFKKEIGFAPQYYRNMAWVKKQRAAREPKTHIPFCFIQQYKLEGNGDEEGTPAAT